MIKGTHLDVPFSRVVDGDTIRVFLPGAEKDESLRILALDTEESRAGGGKPVTPWGKEAKKRAETFFQNAESVTIEFPGQEDLETCLRKYRGNYGRILVYVYRDGVDFQETMIREGYSPYFVKYGNAEFPGHHQRYRKAEREAQRHRIGVWNQTEVNGHEFRNYAALGTWWELRARIIDDYRKIRSADASVLDSRLDYDTLKTGAQAGERASVFTEMRSITRVGGDRGLIGIGSNAQPFSLFLPDIDSEEGRQIVNLLETRYISDGEVGFRRGYAFVTGQLSTYLGRPQMILTSADQITDRIPYPPAVALSIASLLPDPAGPDAGFERVALANSGRETADLQGWVLQDRIGNQASLTGTVDAGQEKEIALPPGKVPLNNTGDEVALIDPDGNIQHRVSYTAKDVAPGEVIRFS